jgi:hypothetical protein
MWMPPDRPWLDILQFAAVSFGCWAFWEGVFWLCRHVHVGMT